VSVVFDRVSCGRSYSAETRSRLCIDGGGAAPGPVSYATLGKVRVKGCCARQWNEHTQGRPVARPCLSLIHIYRGIYRGYPLFRANFPGKSQHAAIAIVS
jgi:hypothetical protein